jgi:4-amino-4-deoxy-L-arabinose transferase-like glycosyltransferase/membrane-associated phospholipid phosphatase
MHWLETLDTELFRFINQGLMNPFFDWLMPLVTGNETSKPLLFVVIALVAVWLLWKGGPRGRVFVLMIAVVLGVGDGFICNTIKHAVGRQRPFKVLEDVHCLIGMSGSGSLPSSHAANWFAATMVAFIYYRRTIWFMLPVACLVGFSRVYNGVHYPSDVAVGAILGAGYAVAIGWILDSAWQIVGQRWFPLWWARLPSLLEPTLRTMPEEEEEGPAPPRPRVKGQAEPGFRPPHVTADQQWVRLGYILIAVLLVARMVYIAGKTIELCEDEAYQWLWSKHLALSYYSKPPMIAYVQFLGTHLWGNNAFGVRFFSPIISAIISFAMLRFFAREVNARAGFFLLLILTATPLTSLGSVLMTVDPLSVLFWTLAMLAGWKASQENGTTGQWLLVGLWMGLGFLSKYTGLFQWLCWVVFFVLWSPARKHLRRPGPYLALLINLVCALPVFIWNQQNGWVTIRHVAEDAGVNEAWNPTLKYVGEFLVTEFGLLNPIFFVAAAWAAIAFWRRGRHNPRLLYFFSMGAPLFLAYFLHSFRGRVLPNWIAPSILPLFCLMVIYWDTQWRLGLARPKGLLAAGISFGIAAVLVVHNTDVLQRLTGHNLPVNRDPLHRVRVWSNTARAIGEAREELLAEGKPVFFITTHYGMAGMLSFYLPEARAHVSDSPLVYFVTSSTPHNQLYFWPGYTERKGENAILVQELNRADPTPQPPPQVVESEFESVTDLGVRRIMYHGNLCRPVQIFACRGLK